MLRNRLVRFNGVDLNTPDGISIWQNIEGQAAGIAVNPRLRERSMNPSQLDNVTYSPRNQPFTVRQGEQGTLSNDDFNAYVQSVFLPDGIEREIVVELEPEVEAVNHVLVTSFRRDSATQWSGTFQYRDPIWLHTEPSQTDDLEVTLEGNIPVRPRLKIIAGKDIRRQRFIVTDTTGHSIRAYPIRIVPENNNLDPQNYRVFVDHVEVPFHKNTSGLFCWVSAGVPPSRALIDIYMGTEIDNTRFAQRMNRAGITLDGGISTGTIVSEPRGSSQHPLASSLAWHPGISVRHPSRRNYQFGLRGDRLEIIADDVIQRQHLLENDADSFVLVSPTEIDRISGLNLVVTAGYQRGSRENDEGGGNSDVKLFRYRLTRLLNGAGRVTWSFGIGSLAQTSSYSSSSSLSWPDGASSSSSSSGTTYSSRSLYEALTSAYAYSRGIRVWSSGGWTYVRYPTTADISLPTASVTRLSSSYSSSSTGPTPPPPPPGFRGLAQHSSSSSKSGPTSAPLVAVLEAEWLDPSTGKPFGSTPETSGLPEEAVIGWCQAVVKYRRREDPNWRVAWSRTINGGSGSSVTVSLAGISADTPGAVEIAVGIEPLGSWRGRADWGTVELTGTPPVIHLNPDRMPSVNDMGAVDALQIDGTLRNTRNDLWLRFLSFLSDANGIEIDIDARHPHVRGIDGIGVTNGELQTNGRHVPFLLEPGVNIYDVTGDLTDAELLETGWNERVVF